MMSNSNNSNGNSRSSAQNSDRTSNNNSFVRSTTPSPLPPVCGANTPNRIMHPIVQNKKMFNENSKVFVKDLRMLKVPL